MIGTLNYCNKCHILITNLIPKKNKCKLLNVFYDGAWLLPIATYFLSMTCLITIC